MRQPRQLDRGAVSGTLLAVVAVVVIAAAAGLWWFLSGEEPEEVDLETAAAVVTTTTAADLSEDPTAPEDTQPDEPTTDVGVDGTWTVDTSIGSFSFEDATSSFVGFRVEEELASIGATTAVGRTPAVSGQLEIEGSMLLSATLEADFTQLVTDDSRRDNRAKGALETDQFPTGTFVLTEPIDFGQVPESGDTLSVTARGDLTIHGVTNSVEFALEAQLVDDVIVVIGSIEVVFEDYDIEAPSAPIVLSVEDHGTVELQLFFTRA